jgi:hypothetical protein
MRIVKSWRAGVGKSLYKKRMVAELYKIVPNIPRRQMMDGKTRHISTKGGGHITNQYLLVYLYFWLKVA